MTAQATLLYQLQLLDVALTKHKTRLREIVTLVKDSGPIAEAKAALANAEAELKPWQARAQDLDLEIKSIVQKSKEANDQLYGGTVKNPKELQDLQHEIESLQKRQREREESLIEAMMHVDEGKTAIEKAQATLKTVSVADAGQKVDLRAEHAKLLSEARDLEEKRKEAVKVIQPESLQKYEAMRSSKKGQPVSLLVEESCKLCGVEQTRNVVLKVMHGQELTLCQSCGRILALPL